MSETTDPAVRQARAKQALIESGGRRLSINLKAPAVKALARLREHENYQSDAEAISDALLHFSKVKTYKR